MVYKGWFYLEIVYVVTKHERVCYYWKIINAEVVWCFLAWSRATVSNWSWLSSSYNMSQKCFTPQYFANNYINLTRHTFNYWYLHLMLLKVMSLPAISYIITAINSRSFISLISFLKLIRQKYAICRVPESKALHAEDFTMAENLLAMHWHPGFFP